jgi:hypothetical protein
MVGFQEAGLSSCDILALAGHADMTVMRVYCQWIEEGHTQRLHNVTTAWDDTIFSLHGHDNPCNFIHSVESYCSQHCYLFCYISLFLFRDVVVVSSIEKDLKRDLEIVCKKLNECPDFSGVWIGITGNFVLLNIFFGFISCILDSNLCC